MSTFTEIMIFPIVFAIITIKSQQLSCGGFENCISYWDGCNTCGCSYNDKYNSTITICTDMDCIGTDYGTPQCRECGGNYTLLNDKCILPACNLPKESGPCQGYIHRYYYNNETETCESFYYGGCQGNDNNFETPETCLVLAEQCQTITQSTTTQPTTCGEVEHCNLYSNGCGECVCSDDGDLNCVANGYSNSGCSLTGSCDRHYCRPSDPKCIGCNDGYYMLNGKCVDDSIRTIATCGGFVNCASYYDGCNSCSCDGWLSACTQMFCEEKEYQDAECRECEEGYTMIDGECEEDVTVIVDIDICELHSESGACDEALHRYFYDASIGDCLVFIYGGCNGNENNFESEEKCLEECGPLYDDKNAVMCIWAKLNVVFLILQLVTFL